MHTYLCLKQWSSWWTFRIVLIFFGSGRGPRGGGGSVFLENPRGGGLQEGEGPRGQEGVCGELGNWGGGGLIFFFFFRDRNAHQDLYVCWGSFRSPKRVWGEFISVVDPLLEKSSSKSWPCGQEMQYVHNFGGIQSGFGDSYLQTKIFHDLNTSCERSHGTLSASILVLTNHSEKMIFGQITSFKRNFLKLSYHLFQDFHGANYEKVTLTGLPLGTKRSPA